jgi:hypothetical protein
VAKPVTLRNASEFGGRQTDSVSEFLVADTKSEVNDGDVVFFCQRFWKVAG